MEKILLWNSTSISDDLVKLKKKRFLYTLFSIFIFTSLILWENIVKWLEFINWHIILLISHLVVRIFFSNFSSCEYLNDIRLEEHSETLNQLFFYSDIKLSFFTIELKNSFLWILICVCFFLSIKHQFHYVWSHILL